MYDVRVSTCPNTHVEYDGMKRLLLDTPLRYLERRRQYLDWDLPSSLDQSTVSRIKGPLSVNSVDVPFGALFVPLPPQMSPFSFLAYTLVVTSNVTTNQGGDPTAYHWPLLDAL
jgi:hypothetical protein